MERKNGGRWLRGSKQDGKEGEEGTYEERSRVERREREQGGKEGGSRVERREGAGWKGRRAR